MSHMARIGVGIGIVIAVFSMACEKPVDANEATSADNAALTAGQQCLRQATNQELLDELQARLGTSAPGSGGASAAMSFVCDDYSNLQLSVVGPDGQEHKDEVTIASSTNCTSIAQKLTQTRATITHTSLIGVCDNYSNLNRFSVTPEGTLTKLSTVTIASSTTCDSQADAMDR